MNLPCVRGGAGANGQRCPYFENGLETEDEAQAWHVLMAGSALFRLHPMGGVIGLDLPAAILMADTYGYDAAAVADILAAAEPAIVASLNAKKDD